MCRKFSGCTGRAPLRFRDNGSVASISRPVLHYAARREDDTLTRSRLKALAGPYRRYGDLRLHVFLRKEGLVVNAKRTYRLYCEEGLQVRHRKRKRLAHRDRIPLAAAVRPNQRWSLDVVSDGLWNGGRFRVLNIVDDCTRGCPSQIVDFSISGKRLSRYLDQLAMIHGYPDELVHDNGPELTSRAMFEWSHKTGVKLRFIPPGKPRQNACVESFNGKFRDECLNENWFASIHEARKIIEVWRTHYNTIRPHSALNDQTPAQFTQAFNNPVSAPRSLRPLAVTYRVGHLNQTNHSPYEGD
jgi:putative transposase